MSFFDDDPSADGHVVSCTHCTKRGKAPVREPPITDLMKRHPDVVTPPKRTGVEPADVQPFRPLDLPAEIRRMIYKLASPPTTEMYLFYGKDSKFKEAPGVELSEQAAEDPTDPEYLSKLAHYEQVTPTMTRTIRFIENPYKALKGSWTEFEQHDRYNIAAMDQLKGAASLFVSCQQVRDEFAPFYGPKIHFSTSTLGKMCQLSTLKACTLAPWIERLEIQNYKGNKNSSTGRYESDIFEAHISEAERLRRMRLLLRRFPKLRCFSMRIRLTENSRITGTEFQVQDLRLMKMLMAEGGFDNVHLWERDSSEEPTWEITLSKGDFNLHQVKTSKAGWLARPTGKRNDGPYDAEIWNKQGKYGGSKAVDVDAEYQAWQARSHDDPGEEGFSWTGSDVDQEPCSDEPWTNVPFPPDWDPRCKLLQLRRQLAGEFYRHLLTPPRDEPVFDDSGDDYSDDDDEGEQWFLS